MNSLLHSKKFRTNLYKWLFMYVGVLLLFTTVVTYSKYINNSSGNDEARAAKFKINIKEDTSSTLNKYRPTSEIEKEFILDFTELEVTTYFELTFTLADNFKFISLTKDSETSILKSCKDQNDPDSIEKICGTIPIDFNSEIKYKMVVKYTGDTYTFESNDLPSELVEVSWSAEQVTKKIKEG